MRVNIGGLIFTDKIRRLKKKKKSPSLVPKHLHFNKINKYILKIGLLKAALRHECGRGGERVGPSYDGFDPRCMLLAAFGIGLFHDFPGWREICEIGSLRGQIIGMRR